MDIVDRGMGDAFEKRGASHDHSGGAETTLQGIMLDEGSLNWMKRVARCKSFNGRDVARTDVDGEHHAGADGHAVDPNCTCRTSAPITAHLAASHAQVHAKGLGQRGVGLDLECVLFAVQI